MKKVLFGIFAHPDDEAFGPAGTLLKVKDDGYDVHLVLLTDGDAGVNRDAVPNLAATRIAEWRAAAALLGATSATALHYPDGHLATIPAAELEAAVQEAVTHQLAQYSEPVEIAYMTFEPNGLTGHHDHQSASAITTRIAQNAPIWYFCLDSSQAPLGNTAYYEPRAREAAYITDRIDVSAYLPKIHELIDAHYSQRDDGEKRKALSKELLSVECFHITHS